MEKCLGIPELLDYLSTFLNTQSLSACTSVSHSWRLLWTRLLYQSLSRIEAAELLHRYGHLVRRLHWRQTTDRGLDLARRHCSHLQSISLDDAENFRLSWHNLWTHFLGLPSKEDAFPQSGTLPPSATDIKLWQKRLLTLLSPEANGFLSATVQSIRLRCSASADLLEALIFARLCRQQRISDEFDNNSCDKGKDKDWSNDISSQCHGQDQVQETRGAILPSLRDLTLEETGSVVSRQGLSPRSFYGLLVAFPHLETLSIDLIRITDGIDTARGWRDVDLGDDIDTILLTSPWGPSDLTEDIVAPPSVSRLHTLTVTVHDPDHSILPQLLAWMPQLWSLTLRQGYFSFETIRTFVRCCPELKTLILRSNEHVNRRAPSTTSLQENELDSEERRGLESLSTLRFHWMALFDEELHYITRKARHLEKLSIIYRRPLSGFSAPGPSKEFRPTWRGLRRAIIENCHWLTHLRLRFVTDLPADFFWLEPLEVLVVGDAPPGNPISLPTASTPQLQQSFSSPQLHHLVDTQQTRYRVKEWPCAKSLENVFFTEVLFQNVEDNRVFRRNFATWTNLRTLSLQGKGISPEALIPDVVVRRTSGEETQNGSRTEDMILFPQLSELYVKIDKERSLSEDQTKLLVEMMPALEDADFGRGLSEEADRWLSEFRPLVFSL